MGLLNSIIVEFRSPGLIGIDLIHIRTIFMSALVSNHIFTVLLKM